jgi:hypothetical protein
MTRDELIGLVKIKMDEASPFESDEMVSSSLIDSVLDEAISNALLKLPTHRLPQTVVTTSPVKNSDGSGYIPLPEDYLRFVRLKMAGWERPVTELITIESPEYLLQKNTVLRGGVAKPKAAIIYDGSTGYSAIEYYSLPTSTTTHTAEEFYIITTKEAGELSDTIIPFVSWEAASLAFGVIGDANGLQYAMAKAGEQLNLMKQ